MYKNGDEILLEVARITGLPLVWGERRNATIGGVVVWSGRVYVSVFTGKSWEGYYKNPHYLANIIAKKARHN